MCKGLLLYDSRNLYFDQRFAAGAFVRLGSRPLPCSTASDSLTSLYATTHANRMGSRRITNVSLEIG